MIVICYCYPAVGPCIYRSDSPLKMAEKRSLPQEMPTKKRKLSNDGLAPPPDVHAFRRSPSPESGLASWSRGVRGMFSNIGGGDERNEVINGATPEPSNFFSAATSAISTVGSQIPRLSEDIGLFASLARTKLLNHGMVDDKRYEVSADGLLPKSYPPRPVFVQKSTHHNYGAYCGACCGAY